MNFKGITTEDLLLYMYGETSHDQTQAITAALASDYNLRETFDRLVADAQQLDTISFSPRQETINNIMNYAEKALEEITHHV